MTSRNDFLSALSQRMTGMQEAERDRLMEYFTEMIDDRIEMGMSEADAVAALGDIDALLRDALPFNPPAPAENPDDADCSGMLQEIHIHLKNGDAKVVTAPLPEGLGARISATESRRFTWDLTDGVLTVTEVGEAKRWMFLRNTAITLTLSDAIVPANLIADSYGGDIDVRGVQAEEMIVLASSSGDLRLKGCACKDRVELTSRSGDIELDAVESGRVCKAENISGDVKVSAVTAASLRLRTTSGDIKAQRLTPGALAAGTTSGDIEIDDAVAAESVLCEATSGDIDLSRISAPDIRVSTSSSDVDLRLLPRPEGYDIMAQSRSGDAHVTAPSTPGGAPVVVQTFSGDIDVRMIEQ